MWGVQSLVIDAMVTGAIYTIVYKYRYFCVADKVLIKTKNSKSVF